ncbi:MAG: hypothetical protein ACREJX_08015, partial [Polyangiaceae bacterium]
PLSLDIVVAKALQRDVDKRYATAADFLEDLERASVVASRRDVIAEVEFYQGRALDKQRQSLRTLVSEKEPFVPTLGGTVSERFVSNAPPPESRTSGPRAFADAATGGPTPLSPQPRSGPPAWLLALFGAAAIASFVIVTLFVRSRNRTDASASTPPSTSAVVSASAPVADVDLVLLAEKPILSVRAAGIHKIDITGKRASVTIAPWSGAMTIEATLDGGEKARATAVEHGPHELLLESAPAIVPTPPRTSSGNKSVKTASPATTTTHAPNDINLAR